MSAFEGIAFDYYTRVWTDPAGNRSYEPPAGIHFDEDIKAWLDDEWDQAIPLEPDYPFFNWGDGLWHDRYGVITEEGYSVGPNLAVLARNDEAARGIWTKEWNSRVVGCWTTIIAGLLIGIPTMHVAPVFAVLVIILCVLIGLLRLRHPRAADAIGVAGIAYLGVKAVAHHHDKDE